MGRLKLKGEKKKKRAGVETLIDSKTAGQSAQVDMPLSEPNGTADLSIDQINSTNCAASDASKIVFTRESLERYAAWKKEWLKEQGLTEAEYEAGNEKFLRRLRFG